MRLRVRGVKEIVQVSEPRDERVLTTDLELRIPTWLPGGRLALHYERSWDKRAENLVSNTAKMANVTEEVLLQRVGEGDGFADVFQTAGRRVIENGDPVLQDALTRLIASALQGNTRIHEVSYMLTKLEGFQPIHIRIIVALPPFTHADRRRETTAGNPTAFTRSMDEIARDVNASLPLVRSALGELETDQFISTYGSERAMLGDFGVALRGLIDEFR